MSLQQSIDWIKDNAPRVHIFYSIKNDWCYLTDKNGWRAKITSATPLHYVKQLVAQIENTKYIFNRDKIIR